MAAGVYHILIEAGAKFERQIAVLEADGITPRNLSGYTARMQVRETRQSATKILDLASTGLTPKITVTGAQGLIDIALTATDTAALDFESAEYDLEIVNGTEVERLLEGNVRLSKEVTR